MFSGKTLFKNVNLQILNFDPERKLIKKISHMVYFLNFLCYFVKTDSKLTLHRMFIII